MLCCNNKFNNCLRHGGCTGTVQESSKFVVKEHYSHNMHTPIKTVCIAYGISHAIVTLASIISIPMLLIGTAGMF